MIRTIKTAGNRLQKQYLISMLMIGALLLIALLAYAWFSIADIRSDRRNAVVAQSEQLRLSLEDKIDVARGHVFAMRRAVENCLSRPDLADETVSDQFLRGIGASIEGDGAAVSASNPSVEIGSLHVSPNGKLDKRFERDLAAAASFLPGAAADHQWFKMFQWSYYYDAGERWFLIYPALSVEALLSATRTSDLDAALIRLFDADGTRPVSLVGPRDNPKRDMIWTSPYEDAGGKGMMVTLLAPVYLADEYVGAVGTDVTLETLDEVLHAHALAAGRALVVDADGILLADQDVRSQSTQEQIAFSSLFPDAWSTGEDWIERPLAGTSWTLKVHLDSASLHQLLSGEIRLYLGLALLLILAILAIGILQSRRYAGPALRLAAFVEDFDGSADGTPSVPPVWAPIFERVARISRERAELLERTRRQSDELEIKVAERTGELQQANLMLEQRISDLKRARTDLVRADRLGALGELIAGVANRIQVPLDRADRTASAFLADLNAFRAQLAKGLRKSELESFVDQAETLGRKVGQDIGATLDLVSRFRQMAVDRASERPRRLNLREVAENVRAVVQAVSACKHCEIDNGIPDNLEMYAEAGALGQLIHQLLLDAIERAEQGGVAARIGLTAALGNDARGEWIQLILSDQAAPAAEPGASRVVAQTLAQYSLQADMEIAETDVGTRVILRLPRGVD